MKKNLAILLGLAAFAGLAILIVKKSDKKTASVIEGDSEEDRQVLYGEMPGELVDFAAAKAKARRG